MPAPIKSARLNVRLKVTDNELIRHVAEFLGQSVTEFVSSSALERAHEILADQQRFPARRC